MRAVVALQLYDYEAAGLVHSQQVDPTPGLLPLTKLLRNHKQAVIKDADVIADETVFVEIFAHQGRLKGAQFHKVARDALKLITLGRSRPESRLIIAFCDADAAACVSASSWLAEALRTWAIEVLVVNLDADVRAGLRSAQARQIMVNPPET